MIFFYGEENNTFLGDRNGCSNHFNKTIHDLGRKTILSHVLQSNGHRVLKHDISDDIGNQLTLG